MCGVFIFMRAAGIDHRFASKSNSSQRAPISSLVRTNVERHHLHGQPGQLRSLVHLDSTAGAREDSLASMRAMLVLRVGFRMSDGRISAAGFRLL